MGKKYTNTGKSVIGFGNGLRVVPGESIEILDEILARKKAAIEALVESGNLSEGATQKETPKAEEPVDVPKVRKK